MKVKSKLHIGKYLWGIFLSGFLSLGLIYQASAQISGMVYRDFNANGVRTTANPAEPLVSGVVVNAYDDNNQIIASYTTTLGSNATNGNNYPFNGPNFTIPVSGVAYNGSPGSNTGFVPAGTRVRLEFEPGATTACGGADQFDFSSHTSSSVQFVTSPSATVLYGVNSPSDYNLGTANTSIFVPRLVNGDPLGGGESGTTPAFAGFPYNIANVNYGANTNTPQKLEARHIGTAWGVAYSKQSGKIFTSAFFRRHAGVGPMGSGGIYLLEPTTTSFNVTQFYDLDANGYRTRADASTPAYGEGSSFTFVNNKLVNYNGGIDPVSGEPSGLGVIGTNSERGLPLILNYPSFDPAAFAQIGKVSIGDIDISDDGKYLFVTNLFSRKILRLELNDAYNPTSVVAVTEYSLPPVMAVNGEIRPFALKFYKDKLYVGAVATGEDEPGSGTSRSNANLRAYVFELENPTSTASFNSIPVMDFPLNYQKGQTTGGYLDHRKWYPWTDDANDIYQNASFSMYAQPIFTDIEFNERGDMIIGFADRVGYQLGTNNYINLRTNRLQVHGTSSGDVLIAGKNNCDDGWTLESNGSVVSNGVTYTGGGSNNQGPGGGEFFDGENITTLHLETSFGALAVLQGTSVVKFTEMDPINVAAGGVTSLSSINGSSGNPAELYQGIKGSWKSNGLGDIELLTPLAPIEIGNYVWNDTDRDGIQDPNEPALQGVSVQLINSSGAVIATTTTNANGQYYFNSATTSGLVANSNYTVRVSNLGSHASVTGLSLDDLTGLTPGETGTVNSGTTLHNNDARLENNFPVIHLTTGEWGQNNHTYDFGFARCAKPTATATAVQPSCAGMSTPHNGGIQLSGTNVGERYRISQGTQFSEGQATAIAVIPAGGLIINTLPNQTRTYTVRIYEPNDITCFKDVTITITAISPCCPSGDCGTVQINKN